MHTPDTAVHFVGSYPDPDPEVAMRAMLDGAGTHLRTVPTGETNRSKLYVVPILESLVEQGALGVKHRGDWSSLRHRSTYRVAGGAELNGAAMELGYLAEAERALPLFGQLRDEYDRPDLSLQLGMPTDLTMSLMALGPIQGPRNKAAFTEATVRDITAIKERADQLGHRVLIQLEATAELIATAWSYPLRRQSRGWAQNLGAGIANIAALSPEGTRFGVHLCLGSLQKQAGARLWNATPVVNLANSLAEAWPQGRPLELIHAPLASVKRPPSDRPGFYAPLGKLVLDEDTAFYAGFAHEAHTLEHQRDTKQLIESALGRPLDGIASACGLGRDTPANARLLIERAAALAS